MAHQVQRQLVFRQQNVAVPVLRYIVGIAAEALEVPRHQAIANRPVIALGVDVPAASHEAMGSLSKHRVVPGERIQAVGIAVPVKVDGRFGIEARARERISRDDVSVARGERERSARQNGPLRRARGAGHQRGLGGREDRRDTELFGKACDEFPGRGNRQSVLDQAGVGEVEIAREIGRVRTNVSLLKPQGGVDPVPRRTDRQAVRPLVRLQSVVLADVQRESDIAPLARQVPAESHRQGALPSVSVFGQPVLRVHSQTFEIPAQDEVHHAGHGVGAVHRRRAAREDFDAIDQEVGDGPDIHGRGALQATDMAAAIDENQGPFRAESAQVERVGAVDAGIDGLFRRYRRQQRRDVIDHVQQRKLAGRPDVVGSHRLHGQRACQVGVAGDPRTRYDDFLDDFLFRRRPFGKTKGGRGQHEGADAANAALNERRAHGSHNVSATRTHRKGCRQFSRRPPGRPLLRSAAVLPNSPARLKYRRLAPVRACTSPQATRLPR